MFEIRFNNGLYVYYLKQDFIVQVLVYLKLDLKVVYNLIFDIGFRVVYNINMVY